jgi:hypothetical protein
MSLHGAPSSCEGLVVMLLGAVKGQTIMIMASDLKSLELGLANHSA